MPKVMKPILYATAFTLALLPPAFHAVDQPLSFVGTAVAKNNGENGKSEGKGGGSGAGNAGNKGGGSASSNKGSASASGGAANGQGASRSSAAKQTDVASVSKGKGRSDLGRWNAVKDIDHPAIQAHIRNGNFKGTIGLNAAYVLAQDEYNKLEDRDLAAAQTLVDFATAAVQAGKTPEEAVAEYNLANDPDLTVADYEAAVSDAQKLLTAIETLKAVEDAMAAASPEGVWNDIRDAVRLKMGIGPEDYDVLQATSVTIAPAEGSDLY